MLQKSSEVVYNNTSPALTGSSTNSLVFSITLKGHDAVALNNRPVTVTYFIKDSSVFKWDFFFFLRQQILHLKLSANDASLSLLSCLIEIKCSAEQKWEWHWLQYAALRFNAVLWISDHAAEDSQQPLCKGLQGLWPRGLVSTYTQTIQSYWHVSTWCKNVRKQQM